MNPTLNPNIEPNIGSNIEPNINPDSKPNIELNIEPCQTNFVMCPPQKIFPPPQNLHTAAVCVAVRHFDFYGTFLKKCFPTKISNIIWAIEATCHNITTKLAITLQPN